MEAFLKGHAFFTMMALVFLLLSIICRFITGVRLKKLIREAENMSATENALLKQCKLKFQNCYQLNDGAVNVSVFVDKFLQNVRLGKGSLRFWEMLANQLTFLAVLASGIGSCIGLAYGETFGQVFPYYLMAVLTLYAHFSVSGFIDVPGKRAALKVTVADFLENRMSERIRSVERDSRYLEQEEERAQMTARDSFVNRSVFGGQREAAEQEDSDVQAMSVPGASERISEQTAEHSGQEELETLLREFLA